MHDPVSMCLVRLNKRTDGRMDGRTDGRMDGRTDGRTDVGAALDDDGKVVVLDDLTDVCLFFVRARTAARSRRLRKSTRSWKPSFTLRLGTF